MKKFLLSVFLFIPFFAFSQNENENKTLGLDTMIAIINNSLDMANKELDSSNIKIKTAKITLKTTYSKSGGGGLKVFVKASKTWELEKASTITFSYSMDKKSEKSHPNDNFQPNLIEAIVEASKQWESTSTIRGLKKDSFTVDISFIVKKATKAGVEFEIMGAGVDLNANFQNFAAHSVSLTFE